MVYGLGRMAAPGHFHGGTRNRQRVGTPPVAGAVEPDVAQPCLLDHVDGAGRGCLRLGIERDARPEAGIQDHPDGVLLHVVDNDPFGADPGVGLEHIQNQAGALEFVLQMGGVHQNELVVLGGEVDVRLENLELVPCVFVQPNFTDAQHIGALEKLGDDPEHVPRKSHVFGFLRIDAEPGEMRERELRGALGLIVGELAKVVVKAVNAAAVKAGPEGGLANGGAPRKTHGFIVVGGPADHVCVRLDVTHKKI